jgi:KDO2-lipid IV(A) lauroyltransferase
MVEETQVTGASRLPALSAAERRDLLLFRVMRSLPVPLVSRIGAHLGHSLGRRAHPAAAMRARAALTYLYPALAADATALEAAQRRLWANVGRLYAEYCVLERIGGGARITLEDPAALQRLLDAGRPVIMAYIHLGNWEAMGADLARRAPGRICAFAAPLPANRARAQVAALQRSRSPARVITTDRMAWRHALEHLETPGGIFYVAVDEVADGNVAVPSFGRGVQSRGNLGKIVRLAARTGATIQPVYSERLPGAHFRTHVLQPLEFARGAALDDASLQQRTAQIDASFTPVVLRLADQWFGLLDLRP